MTVFLGTISLKGANGKVVKRYIDLGDFTSGTGGGDYALAEAAINQIAGALAAVEGMQYLRESQGLRVYSLQSLHQSLKAAAQ